MTELCRHHRPRSAACVWAGGRYARLPCDHQRDIHRRTAAGRLASSASTDMATKLRTPSRSRSCRGSVTSGSGWEGLLGMMGHSVLVLLVVIVQRSISRVRHLSNPSLHQK